MLSHLIPRGQMGIPNSLNILQAVIEATPDAIFVKDLEGRYVAVNAAAARFVGRTPQEVIGRHDLELYEPTTANGVRREVDAPVVFTLTMMRSMGDDALSVI